MSFSRSSWTGLRKNGLTWYVLLNPQSVTSDAEKYLVDKEHTQAGSSTPV